MAGIWQRARRHLQRKAPLTSREIAEALDVTRTQVSNVLCARASTQQVVRVVPLQGGPLRWRLASKRGRA